MSVSSLSLSLPRSLSLAQASCRVINVCSTTSSVHTLRCQGTRAASVSCQDSIKTPLGGFRVARARDRLAPRCSGRVRGGVGAIRPDSHRSQGQRKVEIIEKAERTGAARGPFASFFFEGERKEIYTGTCTAHCPSEPPPLPPPSSRLARDFKCLGIVGRQQVINGACVNKALETKARV